MISQVATDYEKMQSLMAEREETQSQIDALTRTVDGIRRTPINPRIM